MIAIIITGGIAIAAISGTLGYRRGHTDGCMDMLGTIIGKLEGEADTICALLKLASER